MKNLKAIISAATLACVVLLAAFIAPKADKWKYTLHNKLQTDVSVKELAIGNKVISTTLAKANKSVTSKEYNTSLSTRAGQMQLVITSPNNNADTLGTVFIAPKMWGYYYWQKCKITFSQKTALNGLIEYNINVLAAETGATKASLPKGKTKEITEE